MASLTLETVEGHLIHILPRIGANISGLRFTLLYYHNGRGGHSTYTFNGMNGDEDAQQYEYHTGTVDFLPIRTTTLNQAGQAWAWLRDDLLNYALNDMTTMDIRSFYNASNIDSAPPRNATLLDFNWANVDEMNRDVLAFARDVVNKWRQVASPCEECNYANGGHEHEECIVGEETVAQVNGNSIQVTDEEENATQRYVCEEHRRWIHEGETNFLWCSVCGYTYTSARAYNNPYSYRERDNLPQNTQGMCGMCVSDEYQECASCERLTHYRQLDGGDYCDRCYDENATIGRIRDYSFKPEPVFHPDVPEGKNPLYFGMEIETSFRQRIDPYGQNILRWLVSDGMRGLIYAKGDGSVRNGFEIVTHPMTYEWAIQNFPFARFDELIEQHKALETHQSCGTHIHLSKSAFTKAHFWKFMQVHIKLDEFCGLVGGRGNNAGYGSLLEEKAKTPYLMELSMKKDRGWGRWGRSGVNLSPTHTIELRYPRGGSSSFEIKKNMHWVDALWTFTDRISVNDVKDGCLDDPGYLLWWINNNPYPELQSWISKSIPTPKSLERSE